MPWICRIVVFAVIAAFLPIAQADLIKIGPIEILESHRGPGDLVLVANDTEIGADQTNRHVVVVLGNVHVNGRVRGDMSVVLGNVTLGPDAVVEQKMILAGGQLTVAPGAEFAGYEGFKLELPTWLLPGLQDWIRRGLFWARFLPHDALWAWWVAGMFCAFYMFIGILMPRPVQHCADFVETRPISSFLAGMTAWLLFGPLVVLLVATVFGALVVPFAVCGLLTAYVLGKAGVFCLVGRRFLQPLRAEPSGNYLLELFLGTVSIAILHFVPVVGILAWGILSTLGLGAAVLSFLRSFRGEAGLQAKAEPPPKLRINPDSGPEAQLSAAEIDLLPRAGFWVRLGATLVDFILVMVLLRLMGREVFPDYFIPVWLLYHFVMWAWKGTTLGGLALRLRIYRQDGRPISVAIALVRCLAAIFSAVILGLGFFWAGWNREKLSWHDIIAGTAVAICPREKMLQ